MARTYEETAQMFGVTHEFAAVSTGKRRYGAVYVVLIDGVEAARVMWLGGRRYRVFDKESRPHVREGGWEYITGDGGKVSDVAGYVARTIVHERREAAAKAAAEHPVCDDPACHTHGIAASNARQSAFYAANDRTVEARS